MSNTSGNAYALTLLSPIRNGNIPNQQTSFADEVRRRCTLIPLHEDSPFARVPNTYVARLFVLDDVIYEDKPADDRVFNFNDVLSLFSDKYRLKNLPGVVTLQSKYLVFNCNFHGSLDDYLAGVWQHWRFGDGEQDRDIRFVWQHCVGFDKVKGTKDFIKYAKKCQVDFSLFFNGSTDESLAEQLKALYLKQEFTKFVIENQGKPAGEIQRAYTEFSARVQVSTVEHPSWQAGQSR